MLSALDLFSAAAGGWSLGLHRAGFRTVAACEVVPWRHTLYSQNNPGVRIYDDVRSLTAARLFSDLGFLPDIIVGSPPCQDISSANTKGRGVDGERSGLYFEAVRLVGECRPRWFAFENSSNLRTRGADAVLSALENLGYACWPFVVRASDVGANHERPRSWLIGFDAAHADEDRQLRRAEHGQVGILSALAGDLGHASGDGWAAGRTGRRSEPDSGLPVEARRDVEHAESIGHEGRRPRGHRPDGYGSSSASGGDAADPDQARQAHGCMDPSLRQAEISDDGRGSGWGDDRPGAGQVGLCSPDRGAADGPRPLWSLDDLAHRLRVDAGIPARLADTRVAVGGPRGTSAGSLIVEAYGDSVVPQIPEAIGRAILRVEAALNAVAA